MSAQHIATLPASQQAEIAARLASVGISGTSAFPAHSVPELSDTDAWQQIALDGGIYDEEELDR